MTNEQEEWTPPYHEWTIRKITEQNNILHHEPKEWGNWYGMTVKNLVAALVTYNPNMPVCIRRDIGWSGMGNYDIEIKEVIIKSNSADDYSQCRDAIRAGTMPHMEVLALTMDGYSTEDIDSYDFEIEEEE
tara:strand:+ start:163 stop:555 length:393 start_codon:yes stop_codon:yes gene_type:complete